MAVFSVTTDLTTLNNGESGTWVEMTGWASGGVPQVNTTEWYIQGGGCTTAAMNNKTTIQSIAYNHGSDISGSFATDDCFFMWQICLASVAADTFANGGLRALIGSAQGDFNAWKTGGSDFGKNPVGGWQNVAIDPTFTPVDYSAGTPGAAYQYFGSGLLPVGGVSKGEMHCVDILTYGRGELILEFGDLGNGYGTFVLIATSNDAIGARWGLFQLDGKTYLWKGLISFGNATNAVDFRDSNRSIYSDDTPRTYATFNRIEVSNASSRVDWTTVNIEANDSIQLSLGEFEMIDNATVNKTTCTFTDLNTFIYMSNATIISSIYRRCLKITQGGATFTGCTFDDPTNITGIEFILATNPSVITECDFISNGVGHGVRCDTVGTYNWHGNNDSGYTGTRGTNLVVSSGSNDAMFYNNSGGLITLNIDTAGQSPTVRNGAGATTQVNNTVNITFTVQDMDKVAIQNAQVSVYDSNLIELMNEDTLITGVATQSYSFSTDEDIKWRVRKSATTDNPRYFGESGVDIITANGFTLTVTLKINPNI